MRGAGRITATHQQRGVSPVVGTLLVVALTVIVALTLSTAVLGGISMPEASTTAVLELSVENSTITLTHTHGEPLAVEALSVRIAVDGEPLEHQPPVPFFAANGFDPGPTGAFNPAGDTELAVGESASLTLASTNSPTIDAGSTVTVTLYTDGSRLLRLETTA